MTKAASYKFTKLNSNILFHILKKFLIMKKSNKLFYAFTSFLLVICLLSLHSCADKAGTGTETEKNPQTIIGSPEKPGSAASSTANKNSIIEGHIALPATTENKMGLVYVHGAENGIDHPLAYGMPYHFNDAAAGDTPLMKGDDIQFSIKDDGKFYIALNIKRSTAHTHQNNVVLDSSRMILLDDHSNSPSEVDVIDQTKINPDTPSSKRHKAGHIGEFVGNAESGSDSRATGTTQNVLLSNKKRYAVYAVEVYAKGSEIPDTTYMAFPLVSDKLIGTASKADTKPTGGDIHQLMQENPWKGQTFYYTLSDIKLTWVPASIKAKYKPKIDITKKQATLVREILPYHWHWYDRAALPK